jgi:hypothetical protein
LFSLIFLHPFPPPGGGFCGVKERKISPKKGKIKNQKKKKKEPKIRIAFPRKTDQKKGPKGPKETKPKGQKKQKLPQG